jgi:hypothetical protein
MDTRRSKFVGIVGFISATILIYARLIRPWHLRWGATPGEVSRLLPGDDIVTQPVMSATHAITIQAPVDRVWPWVVQIGQRRGGFYSYDWLENLLNMDIHNADDINPEWQNPQAGDVIRFWRGTGIPVLQIKSPRLMVLGGSFAPEQTMGGSWTFVLESLDSQTTRLIVRTRVAEFSPLWLSIFLYRLVLEPAHFLMERRMLLGIKVRAEKTRG